MSLQAYVFRMLQKHHLGTANVGKLNELANTGFVFYAQIWVERNRGGSVADSMGTITFA